ncbi:three-Cys-motif partner protein TcmP [Gynuella sp.]|uniref:three-Cys-motif partner protein TcmP n=1 Tax=Gynuella sp. TaxID=2969146 RepID=UPI003D108FC8
MAKKDYDWENGAVLEDHSRKKHTILAKYFEQYLLVRCRIPNMERFRLAVVDGFSGSGEYACGTHGSPLILLETVINALNFINHKRIADGFRTLSIECLFIFNDLQKVAIDKLKQNIAPLEAVIRTHNNIKTEIIYQCKPFEKIYPDIKQKISDGSYSNVFFNLDQCGTSHVSLSTIRDIVNSWKSSEVLFTFAIETLLSYLPTDPNLPRTIVSQQMDTEIYAALRDTNVVINKKEWLGRVEQIVSNHLRDCAVYVSPFSIHNPNGWKYWLVHFAKSYRARQVYNDILHDDDVEQAHFGRSGLKMLSYNPSNEGQLYLFNESSRESAKADLYDDIPRFISESGDMLLMQDFYSAIYSETPAHSDDIHDMIIENSDLEVITDSGGTRRSANAIKSTDFIKLKPQRQMFFMHEKPTKK